MNKVTDATRAIAFKSGMLKSKIEDLQLEQIVMSELHTLFANAECSGKPKQDIAHEVYNWLGLDGLEHSNGPGLDMLEAVLSDHVDKELTSRVVFFDDGFSLGYKGEKVEWPNHPLMTFLLDLNSETVKEMCATQIEWDTEDDDDEPSLSAQERN